MDAAAAGAKSRRKLVRKQLKQDITALAEEKFAAVVAGKKGRAGSKSPSHDAGAHEVPSISLHAA